MYKGIDIRSHNKTQLAQAKQVLSRSSAVGTNVNVLATVTIKQEQSEGDSSMWVELERNAQIAKQNKMRMETIGIHSSTTGIECSSSNSYNWDLAGVNTLGPNANSALIASSSQMSNRNSKERLGEYMKNYTDKFDVPACQEEMATEIQGIGEFKKKEKEVRQKKQRRKEKRKAKQIEEHYIPENIIERKDPNLFSIDQLKVETPLTRNYRIGCKQEWEGDKRIDDYKLQFVLRKFARIKNYRSNQKAIIKCSLLGNDVFVCMPTGGGKSLTFQAMTFIQKGIYLCILPLVSLIIDQEEQARKIGIQAFSLTGSKQVQDNKMVYQQLLRYEPGSDSIVIFCTPQKINKSPQFFGVLSQVYDNKTLVKIVIDEVHCVSTWGKQFRQDYENLSSLKENFPHTPILGLTATVTQVIKQDIIKRLRIENCYYFQSSFNRPNLRYEVREKNKEVLSSIVRILNEHENQSGIIYCISRKECEEMCTQLQSKQYKVAYYHANISENEKREIQAGWMENRIQIIIATIAFGMGINKPDVRFVIHHSLSKSLENYYQESGRAGRDGEEAKCILFYRRADKTSLQSLIMKNEVSKDENKNFCMRQLSNMIKYCEDRYTCRRKFQLQYLGERDFDPAECNRTCDNCLRGLRYVEVECIKQAKCLVSFMMQMERARQNINQNQIIWICKGRGDKKFKYKLDQIERVVDLLEIRDMLGKWNKVNIDELMIELCSHEIFYEKIITSTFKNNTVSNFYIKVNFPIANKFLQRVQTLPMKRSVSRREERRPNSAADFSELEIDFSGDDPATNEFEDDKYLLQDHEGQQDL